MTLVLREEPMTLLGQHAQVSIVFVVEHVFEVSIPDSGLDGILLREAPVAVPWEKDYDSIEGEGPTGWPKRFDTSRWGLIKPTTKTPASAVP